MSPRNGVVLVSFPLTQSPAATATTLTSLKSSEVIVKLVYEEKNSGGYNGGMVKSLCCM
ncbi:hypothetical protein HN51_032127, partial [Arachis hypogaea]